MMRWRRLWQDLHALVALQEAVKIVPTTKNRLSRSDSRILVRVWNAFCIRTAKNLPVPEEKLQPDLQMQLSDLISVCRACQGAANICDCSIQ